MEKSYTDGRTLEALVGQKRTVNLIKTKYSTDNRFNNIVNFLMNCGLDSKELKEAVYLATECYTGGLAYRFKNYIDNKTRQNDEITKHIQLNINYCKERGYGWREFAESVERSGKCTRKQEETLENMVVKIYNQDRKIYTVHINNKSSLYSEDIDALHDDGYCDPTH